MKPSIVARGGARLVDAVLLAALGVGWGYPLDFGIAWLVGHAALVYLYFVAGDALAGRTVGKALLGLRVQGPDGERPSWGASALREAFVLVGAVPFVGPLIALGAWIAIVAGARASDEGQGFHDRLAGGTRVVRA